MSNEIRKCIICGKEFTPYPPQKKRQITCGSPECQLIRKQRYVRAPEQIIRDNQKLKMKIRHEGRAICRLCGKPIIRNEAINERSSSTRMHDSCVFDDCAKTLKDGKPLSQMQKQRLYVRGYTLPEFYEEVKENEIEGTKVQR